MELPSVMGHHRQQGRQARLRCSHPRHIKGVIEMIVKKYTDEQVEKAVDNLIDSWDMDTLVDFAHADRLHYFLHHADQEEIKMLVQDFGNGE